MRGEFTTSTTSTIGTQLGGVKKPNREKATEWLCLMPVTQANDQEPCSLPVQIQKANGCVQRYSLPIVRDTAILSHSNENPEFPVLGTLRDRPVLGSVVVVIVRSQERILGHLARRSSVWIRGRLGKYWGCLEVLVCSLMWQHMRQ